LRAAFPDIAYVDGGAGIARRVAFLTREQPWPAEPRDGIVIYTGREGRRPLPGALARFGISEIETL
jgi:glutamate racemase